MNDKKGCETCRHWEYGPCAWLERKPTEQEYNGDCDHYDEKKPWIRICEWHEVKPLADHFDDGAYSTGWSYICNYKLVKGVDDCPFPHREDIKCSMKVDRYSGVDCPGGHETHICPNCFTVICDTCGAGWHDEISCRVRDEYISLRTGQG